MQNYSLCQPGHLHSKWIITRNACTQNVWVGIKLRICFFQRITQEATSVCVCGDGQENYVRLISMTALPNHVRMEGTALISLMTTIAPAHWNMLLVLDICSELHALHMHLLLSMTFPCTLAAAMI